MSEPWRPILEGEAAARAWEAVEAIAEALPSPSPSPSLAEGAAGYALFYAYLAQRRGREQDHEAARAHLEEALGALSQGGLSPSLYFGFPGIAFALAHLSRALYEEEEEDEDPLEALDEILEAHTGRAPWEGEYELFWGLVGLGVYALERLPRPGARRCLENILCRLEELAEARPEGLCWWTSPALLGPAARARYPRGYYNLGLVHGSPGVIALLARLVGAGVEAARARRLLGGAVSWLLAQRPEGGGFPSVLIPGEAPLVPPRPSWCYGEASVAAALLSASEAAGEGAWAEAALRLAARACPPAASAYDASLCYGAAGLGQIFGRLHQRSGEPWLREAARAWLEAALALRRPGQGVAGFLSLPPEAAEPRNEPGLLTGAAGIGLVLLSALSPEEPGWDRLLLLP